ncbi:hypothetical protein KVF89_06480 [Nocardioides carbamazepini]|uniref:hypothetical protein n=1 Tax=Nocardioides carbamazepini TaxID=2854259 RepID=UPI00214A7AD4|nr:hypothetical protein [Nocardioides carbamazepini]MCR1782173.1 hypothetical protein [Nocardioides carbamazepini]
MNEHDLTTVMERAAERLDPDVADLVAGGARRGRRRLRRRRATVGVSGAVVAALAVGAVAWASSPGGGTARDLPVATPPAGGSTAPGDGQRGLPDDDALVQRLLDHLPDGEVTDLTTTPVWDQPDAPYQRGLEIGLRLDGAAVEVRFYDGSVDPEGWARSLDPGPKPAGCDASLVDADQKTWSQAIRDAAETATDVRGFDRANPPPALPPRSPEQECISWASGMREQKCAADPACLAKRTAYSPEKRCGPEGRQLPDGSWLWPRSGDGGDGSDTSGFTGNWASICRADGWTVDVSAFNSPDGDTQPTTVVSDEPPLSLEQVTSPTG